MLKYGATREIGDGLREMLMTSLFDSNHFIVLDRQAMKDMMLEQDLSASRRAEDRITSYNVCYTKLLR